MVLILISYFLNEENLRYFLIISFLMFPLSILLAKSKSKMSFLEKAQQQLSSQPSSGPSQTPNDIPPPPKHKKSKFASGALSNKARTNEEHQQKNQKKQEQLLVANQTRTEQAYWGKMKPYFFHPITNAPRIVIAPSFLKSLLLNIFIIGVICVAMPLLTTHSMFTPIKTLQQREAVPQLQSRKQSIYIFSAAWTCFQLVFMGILLVGNPGYGDPLAQKQLSLEEQEQIMKHPQRRLQGYSRCSTCKAIVDNSVFHCPQCDLCCQGFRNHCEWIGKCVGYRNQIFLSAYYYGFFIGSLLLMMIVMASSVPSQ